MIPGFIPFYRPQLYVTGKPEFVTHDQSEDLTTVFVWALIYDNLNKKPDYLHTYLYCQMSVAYILDSNLQVQWNAKAIQSCIPLMSNTVYSFLVRHFKL